MEKTLSSIVDTIQEKLGKEEAGKISDSLADILVIEEANGKLCAMAKEETTKALNSVLLTASEKMRNGYNLADN